MSDKGHIHIQRADERCAHITLTRSKRKKTKIINVKKTSFCHLQQLLALLPFNSHIHLKPGTSVTATTKWLRSSDIRFALYQRSHYFQSMRVLEVCLFLLSAFFFSFHKTNCTASTKRNEKKNLIYIFIQLWIFFIFYILTASWLFFILKKRFLFRSFEKFKRTRRVFI